MGGFLMNSSIDLPALLWWEWLLSGAGAILVSMALMAIAATKRVGSGIAASLAGLSMLAGICCTAIGIWHLVSTWMP